MTASISYDGGLTAGINVKNLDAAVAWYSDVLGMKLLYKLDDMGWGELKSPVGRVNVGLSQQTEVAGGGGATLTWGVTDIAAARAALEAKGVTFEGPTQTIPGMVSLANFTDPDGNGLALYQDLSEGQG